MSGDRSFRVRRVAVAVAAVVTVLTSCGDGSSAGGDTTTTTAPVEFERFAGGRVEINVLDNTFEPRYAEVPAGTTLVFTNNGRNPHDITPVEDGAFETVSSEDFGPGTTVEITLSETGEIPYYCSIHGTPKNGQNGIIKVVP